MKNSKLLTGGIVFAMALGAITALASKTEGFVLPDDVRSLFGQKCAACHKGKYPPQGLNLEPANVLASLDTPSRQVPSLKIIDTKDPEASYLLKKVRREKGITGKPMPPGKALTAEEIRALEAWIAGLAR